MLRDIGNDDEQQLSVDISSVPHKSLFKKVFIYFFLRETETARVGRGRERERESQTSLELPEQGPTWGSNSKTWKS